MPGQRRKIYLFISGKDHLQSFVYLEENDN